MIQAVLFDLYDTLARIEVRTITAAREAMARACGVEVEALHAQWRSNQAERALGSLGTLEDEIASMLQAIEVEAEPSLIQRLADADRRAWTGGVSLYPDTLPTLISLQDRGFPLGLVSNCSCQGGDVIHAHGLHRHFPARALSFELGIAKPDPRIFEAACVQLGLPPAACAYVADGAGGELEAARALGMVVFFINRGDLRHRDGPPTGHHFEVASLLELLDRPELQRVGGQEGAGGPR